jgi:ribosomal protein L37AE/L43A
MDKETMNDEQYNGRYTVVEPDNGLSEQQRTWFCVECKENTVHEIRFSKLVNNHIWFCVKCKGSFVVTGESFLSWPISFFPGEDIKVFWKDVVETSDDAGDLDRLPKRVARGEEFPLEVPREGYFHWQEETETSVRFHRWHRMDNGVMCHNWKIWFKKSNIAIKIHWHRWYLLLWPRKIEFQRKESEFWDPDTTLVPRLI